MPNFTKKSIENHGLCPRLAKLGNVPKDHFGAEEGVEVGKKAAEFFGAKINETVISTDTQISQFPVDKKFSELQFRTDNAVVYPDISWFDAAGDFHFIEVKSSKYSQKSVKEHTSDVARQVAVLNYIRPDIRVAFASLALLNPEAVGAESHELFKVVDLTEKVVAEAATIDTTKIIKVLSEEPVEQSFCKNCKACEHRITCFPNFPKENSIFDLPSIRFPKLQELYNNGIVLAGDVPNDGINPNQQNFVRACKEGKPYIDKGILDEFLEKTDPKKHGAVHYLDFETVMPALPLYDHQTPYTLLPFQFSLVTVHPDGEITPHDFLHDTDDDPTESFVNALIENLGSDNYPIVVYTSFEKTVIKNMIERTGKDEELSAISNRFCDLAKCVKDGYFHPKANGKYSIKIILPIMVPEMSYEGMNVADGGKAMQTWSVMRKSTDPKEREKLRKDLTDYCHQDAIAMLRIQEGVKREYQKLNGIERD